ncbi:DNA methyltransferase [Photobacterium damselae]|uniref:DNA methyltransferase n=1 Tax=Photobacterium damselae TaxID=38293 RepID=UPI0040684FB4
MSSTHGEKLDNDNYQTPIETIDALLAKVTFRPNDEFLEPCKGLEERIFSRIPLPEEQKSWAEIACGVDYLSTSFPKKDVIITNPPFSISEEFIQKMFSELKDDGTLIFLQRVNFLGSRKRIPFWNKIGFPDKSPIIIPRPRFVNGSTDSCEYSWFIYDKGERTNQIPKGFSHIVSEPKPATKTKTKAKAKRTNKRKPKAQSSDLVEVFNSNNQHDPLHFSSKEIEIDIDSISLEELMKDF